MTVIGRYPPKLPTIGTTTPTLDKTPRARLSWPKPPHIDLKRMRVSTPKAPKLPTLDDRMGRFLERLSNGTGDEASRALNELAMMVTAEAIEREVPATEILTPIAAKIIGRWNNHQVYRARMKLLEHWESLTGSKTRLGIAEMLLNNLNDDERMEAELEAQFELLKQNLNDQEGDHTRNEGLIYGQSAAFVDALERYGEDRIAPALMRCFKRILPELKMTDARWILDKIGVAGKSLPHELYTFRTYEGTDWVKKRACILVLLHDAFYLAQGRKPPKQEATLGHGPLCIQLLEEYPQFVAANGAPNQLEGKGKERDV